MPPGGSPLAAALAAAQVWLRRPYVVGLAAGHRHRAGDYHAEACVVVKVSEKLDAEGLRKGRRRPFPSRLAVKVGSKTHRVSVDVREVRERAEYHGVVSRAVTSNGEAFGAAGPVVRRADGTACVLVAAHCADRLDQPIECHGGIRGTVGEIWADAYTDLALVALQPPLHASAGCLPSGFYLQGLRPIDEDLLGKHVFFHRLNGKIEQPIVREVWAVAPFGGSGFAQKRNLVAIDRVTLPGESGTILYDGNFRAIGTLVGGYGTHSYFAPCGPAFQAIGLTLITGA